jgi:hypothetical protein
MTRKIASVVLVALLASVITGPVEAKKKPKPAPITYYLNWGGDCAGYGFLSLTSQPNDASCALFFPELGNSYSFFGDEGTPFALDTSKVITLDFVLNQVASLAADFEVVLEGTVNGKSAEIASGTQTVLVGVSATPAAVHYDLEPDASLNGARISDLRLTVTWTNGVTYSTMDLQSGSATLVISGAK